MVRINIVQAQKIETEMLKETVEILDRNEIVFYMAYGSALGTVRHNGPIPWDADTDILVPMNLLDKAKKCLERELTDKFRIHELANDKSYKLVFPRVALPNSSSDYIHVDIFPLIGLPDENEKQVDIVKELDKRLDVFMRYKHMRQNIVHPTPIKLFIGRCIELFCPPVSKKILLKQFYKILNKYPYESATYVSSAGACYGIKNIMKKDMYGTPEYMEYCGFKVPVPEKWDDYLKNYYKDYMKCPPEAERNKGFALTFDIADSDYEKIKEVIEG